MIIIDLFNEVNFDDIWEIVKNKHPFFLSDSFLDLSIKDKTVVIQNSYKTIKDSFILMQKMECLLDENIIMVVVKEMDPDDMKKERFVSYLVEKNEVIEKEKLGQINIWNDDELTIKHFGYNFIKWEEILGYELCPKSIELDELEVVAEIFCEITRFGFDENRIKNLNQNISKDLGDTNLQEEVTYCRKKKCYDKWFSVFCDKIGISKAPKELTGEVSEEKIIMKNNHLIHIEYIKSIIENGIS